MEELIVLSQWVETPEGKRETSVWATFDGRCTDVTYQPVQNLNPEPNVVTVRCRCDTINADLIEASDNYVVSRETYTPDPSYQYKRIGE